MATVESRAVEVVVEGDRSENEATAGTINEQNRRARGHYLSRSGASLHPFTERLPESALPATTSSIH